MLQDQNYILLRIYFHLKNREIKSNLKENRAIFGHCESIFTRFLLEEFHLMMQRMNMILKI